MRNRLLDSFRGLIRPYLSDRLPRLVRGEVSGTVSASGVLTEVSGTVIGSGVLTGSMADWARVGDDSLISSVSLASSRLSAKMISGGRDVSL